MTDMRCAVEDLASLVDYGPTSLGLPRVYTGVGSRATPEFVLATMTALARWLDAQGWHLRTGGAGGADAAFAAGARKETTTLYLPVPGWRGLTGFAAISEAFDLAASVHPAWERCSAFARRLHARNVHQVLGADLCSPSAFLVCWTPGGRGGGGTRTAIQIARRHGVPVVDMGTRSGMENVRRTLGRKTGETY